MAGYVLGVDLGTTFTAAAVAEDGLATPVALGQRSNAVPSVVHLAEDGTVLVGEPAVRRAIEEPQRVAREMKRRIGDPVPMLVGGAPWAAEALQARLLRWVVDRVTAEQGRPPTTIVVTHPASWAAFKLDLLAQAVRHVGVSDLELVPEPVAAAAWYATSHRVGDGDAIAVYDLGGGTFDAAVVRRRGRGFELLGTPDGLERLGGIDFDAAVLAHVTSGLGETWSSLDADDPEVLADVADLRRRCVEAKEALSADTSAAVPVRLPGVRTTVRMTRDELESALRGPLGETVVALRRTIASAGLEPADLRAVLLVGGSSRIPLVAELVAADLGVPVAVDADPKLAVALGAALSAPVPEAAAPPPAEPPEPPVPLEGRVGPEREEPSPPDRLPRRPLLIGGAVAVVAAVLAAALLLGGGDDDEGGEGGGGAAAGSDDVLRIGVLAPETGSLDFVAEGMLAGADLAIEALVAAGEGIDLDVELVVADTGEPGSGQVDAAMDELLDEDVDVVVGPADRSDMAAAVARVAEEGLVGCSAVDTWADSLAADDDRWFQTIPNQYVQAGAIAQAVAADGASSAALVVASDRVSFGDAVAAALEDADVAVERRIDVDADGVDAGAVAAGLNDGPTQPTIVLTDTNDAADIVNESASVGYLGPFYGDESVEMEAFGERAALGLGADVPVIAISAAPNPSGESDDVATDAEELADFPFAATYVYDCMVLAAVAAEGGTDAIEASRDGEPCLMTDCLALARDGVDVDYSGASGPVDLDQDGDVTTGVYDRWEWNASGVIEFAGNIDV